MDFFDLQENARKKTRILVFYFLLTIAALIGSLYYVFALLVRLNSKPPQPLWIPELFLGVTLGVLLLVLLGSLYKIAALRGGGAAVAQSLGGSLVPPNTRDFKERRLLNVVEEMAIAAGMPPPPVYVQPRPVYVQPRPVYYGPPPAHYAPPRVVYRPGPGHYWGDGHHRKPRKHHRRHGDWD